MAGYWPCSFFFCVCVDQDEVEVHKHAKKQKKNKANWTEQARSIKDLLYGIEHQNINKFSLWNKACILSGQD